MSLPFLQNVLSFSNASLNRATSLYPDGLGASGDATVSSITARNSVGKVGTYAWEFNGTTNYVSSISSDLGSTWSIAFWVKGKTASQGNTKWQIMGKGTSDPNEEFAIGSYATFLDYETSPANINNTLSTYDDAAWHFIVLVFDNGVVNATKIYIDGSQAGSSATANNAATKTATMFLGKVGVTYFAGTHFAGYLDEFSYWTRILSGAEITTLYNSGTGISVPSSGVSLANCKIYYNFEQTSGNLINQAIP